MKLDADLKQELEKEYFLIGKKTFMGGALVTLIAILGVSWSSAKLTLESAAGKATLVLLEEAEEKAKTILTADDTLNELLVAQESFSDDIGGLEGTVNVLTGEVSLVKEDMKTLATKGNKAPRTFRIKTDQDTDRGFKCHEGSFVSGVQIHRTLGELSMGLDKRALAQVNFTCSPLR